MTFKLDFELNTWVEELIIEADSEDAAWEQLASMTTLADLVEAGAITGSEIEVREARISVLERTLVAQATNVVYNLEAEELEPSVAEYLRELLPKELTVTLTNVTDNDDIEERIKDEILVVTDHEVDSLDYQIIETK